MEHHRGLPVVPTVAMPAELGTGQGWHSDRACWGTVGNAHTCCFFLPVCFSKCLPKEGLFPRWRWSTWWKDCGDQSAAKVHPATGSKKRVRRFGRKRMETENPSKDRLKPSRDEAVWPHLSPSHCSLQTGLPCRRLILLHSCGGVSICPKRNMVVSLAALAYGPSLENFYLKYFPQIATYFPALYLGHTSMSLA